MLESEKLIWTHVDSLSDSVYVEELGKKFGVHPLTIEDMLNPAQRTKLEDHGEYIFIAYKAIEFNKNNKKISSKYGCITFGEKFVITVSEGDESTDFKKLRERFDSGDNRLNTEGSDFLAYSIIDNVVDNYFTVLDSLGDQIDTAENMLIERRETKDDPMVLQNISKLKRDVMFIHKSARSLRDAVDYLESGSSKLVKESTHIYIRDLYDHTIQVTETADTYRDMLTSLLDMYISTTSHRLNEVMKVLTIISTIFIPLTFIVGVYGMNFRNMPELYWTWGYFGIMAIMLVIALCMIYYFKKKKWF